MSTSNAGLQICLNSVNFLGPVTSLILFDDDKYLCAAQGSFLRIYCLDLEKDANTCWKTLKIPFRNRVHGMLACRDGLLIWGGYNLGMVVWNTWEIFWTRTPDWIFNAVELNTESEYAVVTSKNEVLIYSYLLSKWKLSSTISCQDSPLLFFAALQLTDDCITVASASAFGEIYLWSFPINGHPSVISTYGSLKGHEGACFDIRFSDDGQYLSTVSEDRTVRLWDLKKEAPLLATGFGHTARVWKCRFLSNSSLVSISEDLTLRKWVYDGVKLDNTETFTGHRGKHIWSIAASKKQDLLFTGGNDGAIRQWKINNDTDIYSFYISSIFKGDVSLSSFCFLSANKLLCLAKNGEISLLDNKIWKSRPPFSLDSEATALCSWENKYLAALGTKTGSLVIFNCDNPSDCFSKKVHTAKIQHLYAAYDNDFYYLLSKAFIGKNAYEVYLHQFSIENGIIKLNFSLRLDLPATFDPTCLTISNDLAFIGSRSGSLSIYKVGHSTCLYCWRRLHEFDTIYNIIPESNMDNSMSLKTVGRDGFVNMFVLKFNPGFQLQKVASEKAIEGILSGGTQFKFPDNDKNLWIWGFHASNFFLKNETTGTDVYTLECGGSHRPWSFSIDHTKQAFAFYKSNQIYVCDSYRNLLHFNKVIRKGGHGREIRAMSFNPEGTLIVSGAEDTNIMLSKFEKEGQIDALNSVKVHNSGIQALCWANDELLFSSGGLEELNALRIAHGQIEGSSTAHILHEATCAKTLTKKKTDGDLRITDVSTTKAVSWGEKAWLVMTILSDSSSRIYLYDEEKRDFRFLKDWEYKSCCLVSVKLFVYETHVFSVISATDGTITVWDLHSQDIEKTPQSIWSASVHQSCVKCLDVHFNDRTGNLSLLTGGDDGAVCHITIKLNTDAKEGIVYVEELEKFSYPEAHASSVTGVLQLRKDLCLSASVDQRILVWVNWEGTWSIHSERGTFVADVGGMFSHKSTLIVFGVGYEVYKIEI
ncbi:tRNA (guanosine 34-2'-O)-methyltransferase regulator Trm734 [Schizosaccharomyces osmophilus]|uniref:tRNA (Guanosine 34-2'-O)-methyltransferase regulator Trm734 n=1 Tax=Schizosaccharomyces osmophilus TaxID=2545709 RepID=A0AAE9W7F8_9SCHI|nr:tRNA (guanosine 34-2'-O)-methyltransferase regulator Trm734 [Schizosaccharomyces osmophilus]WBW71280.1 tRNA (guanosine 34-2'-O)-methyltransferase regulator Trm734 [Schizosaccharomyces osmophilus]